MLSQLRYIQQCIYLYQLFESEVNFFKTKLANFRSKDCRTSGLSASQIKFTYKEII